MAIDLRAENLAELYREAAARHGDRPAFATRGARKRYEPVSHRQLYERGLCLATGLIQLGLQPREHVAVLSDNRFEWILADCAVQHCGAANVPRGTDVTDAEIAHILPHSDARILLVEHQVMLRRVMAQPEALVGVRHLVVMDPEAPGAEGVHRLQDLETEGRRLREAGDRRAEERAAAIDSEDLFTLIYTSGTTGAPKGVALTHANMLSQIRSIPVPVGPEDRAVAILPIWHVLERVAEMVLLAGGACTYYSSIRSLREDLVEVRPTFLVSAPRLWESIHQGILSSARKAPPLRRALFQAAYGCARRYQAARRALQGLEAEVDGRQAVGTAARRLGSAAALAALALPFALADRLVLSKLRAPLGGCLRASLSGGGALPANLDRFFSDIGLRVLEGYGLTETSPVVAVRDFDRPVLGTVGLPIPGTEIRLVDPESGEVLYPPRTGARGEIRIRGPQVMKGYYKDPELTAQVLRDGWLSTGDLGQVTRGGCLRIVGRLKDTIVLLGGENVEPLPLEGRLRESPLIDQCMVVGQDRKHLAVLVVPDAGSLRGFGDSLEALSRSDEARSAVLEEVKRLTGPQTGIKAFEQVKDCRLVPKPFEVGDELTNLYKLRRHVITRKYGHLIDSIYA